jgi:cytoskeletal protein CcmA (bactofilin family)
MYDNTSNVVKLTAAGWEFNMDVTITGNVEIDGNLHITGNIVSDGTIVDSDGNNGA